MPKIKTTDKIKKSSELVFDIPEDVYLEKINCQNITLEKYGANTPWMITSPINFPADQAICASIEKTIKELPFERVFKKGELSQEKLKSLKLLNVSDRNMLNFLYNSGKEKLSYSIAVGADTPIDSFCYIRFLSNDIVYVIGRGIKGLLYNPIEIFADKAIFKDINITACKSFKISGEKVNLTIAREGEKEHLILKNPYIAFINADSLERLFKNIEDIRIERFLEIPVKSEFINKIVWDNNSSVTELILTESEENRETIARFKGDDNYFYIPSKKVRKIIKEDIYKDLLSRKITPFEVEEVKNIIIKVNGEMIFLKNEDVWKYKMDEGEKKTSYGALMLAKNIINIKINEYKNKEDLEPLEQYIDIIFVFSKNKKYDVSINKGKSGNIYSTMDDKLYGVIEDIDIEFLENMIDLIRVD